MKILRALREGDGDALYDLDPREDLSDWVRDARASGMPETEIVSTLRGEHRFGRLPFLVYTERGTKVGFTHAYTHKQARAFIARKNGYRSDELTAHLDVR